MASAMNEYLSESFNEFTLDVYKNLAKEDKPIFSCRQAAS